MFLRTSFADQIPHDNEAGGNSNPGRHPFACRSSHPVDRLRGGKSGPGGAFGIVLMRTRPPKICEHAIAHQFGDMPANPGDLAGNGVLVAAQYVAHRFRIQPDCQCRGVGQVDEHHRQLAPLGFITRRWHRVESESTQRYQQLPPRAQGQPEFLDIAFD